MILSDIDLIKLIREKKLKIEPPIKEDNIRVTHLILHLSSKILKYKNSVADLKDNSSFKTNELELSKSGYELKADEFVLGSTIERVSIPNGYFGFIETRGNIAGAGIQAHNTDGHIDPGFMGNVTLEIKNNSNRPIIIYPNIPFVHLYIFKLTSKCKKLYDGQYQNQRGPTIYKKD